MSAVDNASDHSAPAQNSESEVEAELDASGLTSAVNLASAAGLPTKVDDAEPISELGTVHALSQGYVVVAGKPGSQPIDVMSLVCDSDRRAVGLVCDILGRVSQAFYAVCPTRTDISISQGDAVFAVAAWSSLALVDEGSESNDEEEFSDGMEEIVDGQRGDRGSTQSLALDAAIVEGRAAPGASADVAAPARKPPPPPPPPPASQQKGGTVDIAVRELAPGSKRSFSEMMASSGVPPLIPKVERLDSPAVNAFLDPMRATKAQLVRCASARHPPPPPPPPPPHPLKRA
mmetsp:Transcript_96296/g.220774  ORF Transcript_96296/g.220774 Transcript_96296/m.220774 type:complete len:289 (+) Transcript_96296:602-1468(+)